MTLSDPMYVRKPKRGCHLYGAHSNHGKRNSWDINSAAGNQKNNSTSDLQTADIYKSESAITGTSSVGDIVQIIKSPPTPKESPSSSNSDVVGSSGYTSIGDISVRSAPTPPYSGLSSKHSTPSSSADCSPEIRRKIWHSKILTIKDDLEKVCYRVKHAKDSLDTWRAKRAESAARSKSICCGEIRTIKVEYIEMKRPNRQRSMYKHGYNKGAGNDEEEYDLPDHNISPALILTSLQDCMFTAEVSMANLPSGDITLRISGYRVDIIIDRKKNNKNIDNNHRFTKPFKYGEIDIPIYVDPATLCFEYDEEVNTLRLQAKMKGADPKKYSLSNDDLRVVNKSGHHVHHHSGKGRRLTVVSHKSSQDHLSMPYNDMSSNCSSVESVASENSDTLQRLPHSNKTLLSMGAFRDRAYTK